MVDYENESAQPIYGCEIYGNVLVNEMPKIARYHIHRANSIVFTSKRLPLQPVSSERNHIYIYIHIYAKVVIGRPNPTAYGHLVDVLSFKWLNTASDKYIYIYIVSCSI